MQPTKRRIALVLSDDEAAVLRRALERVQLWGHASSSDLPRLARLERKLHAARNGTGQMDQAILEAVRGKG